VQFEAGRYTPIKVDTNTLSFECPSSRTNDARSVHFLILFHPYFFAVRNADKWDSHCDWRTHWCRHSRCWLEWVSLEKSFKGGDELVHIPAAFHSPLWFAFCLHLRSDLRRLLHPNKSKTDLLDYNCNSLRCFYDVHVHQRVN